MGRVPAGEDLKLYLASTWFIDCDSPAARHRAEQAAADAASDEQRAARVIHAVRCEPRLLDQKDLLDVIAFLTKMGAICLSDDTHQLHPGPSGWLSSTAGTPGRRTEQMGAKVKVNSRNVPLARAPTCRKVTKVIAYDA